MMQTSRANEIRDLIKQLGSRSRARVDAAGARLSIIGARAVEDLIEALEGDNSRIRARIMPLLALIKDPRAREPLIAMLLDRNFRMREVAARSLARFPTADAVAALNRSFGREKRESVKIAVVHSLVELYAAGQEQAVRLPLALLVEAEVPTAVRLAAFSLLGALPASQRRGILGRLKKDDEESIRKRAKEFENAAATGGDRDGSKIPELLGDLAAGDYATWNRAVHRLGICGPSVIEPLLGEMQGRSYDPEYCSRAGMVLKALGPRRGRELADFLKEVEEPIPLQVLVEVIGALGEKSLIYRLTELIERVAGQQSPSAVSDGFDPMQRVRAKAHLELARIGSRVAIQDLRGALVDDNRRVELEMLAAVNLVGKRDELPALLTAYSREDRFMREKIGEVVRTIMKRERIRRNNRMFRTLSREQRAALEAVLPADSRRSRPSRSAPRANP
jgi:HEAT repeat protein